MPVSVASRGHNAWGAATPVQQREWAESVAAAAAAADDQSDARARAAAVQRLHRLRLDPHTHTHARTRVQAFGSHIARGLESPPRALSPAAVSPPGRGRGRRSRPLSPGSRGAGASAGAGVGVGVAAARELVETLQRRVERALAHEHSDEADSRSHTLRPPALRLDVDTRPVGPLSDGDAIAIGPTFSPHVEHVPLHVQQQYELHQLRLREQRQRQQQQHRALTVPHERSPEAAESARDSHLLLLVRQLESDLRERLQQLHEEFERVRRQRLRRENLLDQLANVEAALRSYPFPYPIRDQLLALLHAARSSTPPSPTHDNDAVPPALSPSGGAVAAAVAAAAAASSADATAAAAISPARLSTPPAGMQQYDLARPPAAGADRRHADAHSLNHESHSRVALEPNHHRAVSHAPLPNPHPMRGGDGREPVAAAEAEAHAAHQHQHQHQRGHSAHAISVPSQPTVAAGHGHPRAAVPLAHAPPHAAPAPPRFAAFPRAAAVPVASVEHAPNARMRPPAPAAPVAPAAPAAPPAFSPASSPSPSPSPAAAAATAAPSTSISPAAILDLRSAGVVAAPVAVAGHPPPASALPAPPLVLPGSAAPRIQPDSAYFADAAAPVVVAADAPALTRSFEVHYVSPAASPSPTLQLQLPAPHSAAPAGATLSARPSALSIVRSFAMPAASLLHMPPPPTASAQRAQ